jgi:hypothetical protein
MVRSVWNVDHGFSGNGHLSSHPSPHFNRSHCVDEGRFGNLQLAHAGAAQAPHCLTRDLGTDKPVSNLRGHLRPSAIEKVMSEDDYNKFLVRFESGPHILYLNL